MHEIIILIWIKSQLDVAYKSVAYKKESVIL